MSFDVSEPCALDTCGVEPSAWLFNENMSSRYNWGIVPKVAELKHKAGISAVKCVANCTFIKGSCE